MKGKTLLRTLRPLRYCLGLVPALAIVLWMGMDNDSSRYDRSPKEVRKALMRAHVPSHILGDNVTGSRVRIEGNYTVVTALIDTTGAEIMRFVTAVEPDGEGTRVSTSVEMVSQDNASDGDEERGYDALAEVMLDKLADEHVAAAIEDRPFNMMFAAPAGATQMIGMAPGLKDQIDAANASASEMAKYQQEHEKARRQKEFRKNYGDDWGASGADQAAGWGD